MTTPEAGLHQSPVSLAALPGEAAHADLVAHLAREIYGQGQALSQPLTPALPGTGGLPSPAPASLAIPGLDGAALAALVPGGPDLLRSIAQDHPRAASFAAALAPGFLPAAPASASAVSGAPAAPSGAPAAPDYYFLPAETRGAPALPVATAFDVERVRRDFPALHQSVNGHRLVWLDNAATTHKPQSVIDATSHFYARDNSNIHRAAHTLAARATDAFEGGREAVRRFLNAGSTDEIVFLRGTTEAINLVANSYGRANLRPGDEIILSQIEHHANIVPWQMVAEATGATIRVIPVDDTGTLRLDQFAALLSGRTKIVSVTHVANALGTINPVREIIGLAHAYGVPVLVDAAQSSPHIPLDVQALDADFLVFSGHKVFGPTGIGALYGKKHLLDAMPPWQGGGHMIEDVTFARTVYRGVPEKFEAGTPDIAGAVGLGAALDYLQGVGLPGIAAYEHDLLDYAQGGLSEIRGLRLIGTAPLKASVMSFVIEGQDNATIAQHLDRHGIAVRAGHHCALPALRRFGVSESVRASLAFYNTREDVDVFLQALRTLPRR
ncbi:SufS family cysteine desulfurase [Methylobacterium sp. JK268]